MALRLKEVVFRVRCREAGCPFTSDFSVKENIMAPRRRTWTARP